MSYSDKPNKFDISNVQIDNSVLDYNSLNGGYVNTYDIFTTGTMVNYDREITYTVEKDGKVFACTEDGLRVDITKYVEGSIIDSIDRLMVDVIAKENSTEFDVGRMFEMRTRMRVLQERLELAEKHLDLIESLTDERIKNEGVASDLS